MNHDITHRTVLAAFQITHDAGFADWRESDKERCKACRLRAQSDACALTSMQAFRDGRGVDEIAATQRADQMRVELRQLHFGRGPRRHDGGCKRTQRGRINHLRAHRSGEGSSERKRGGRSTSARLGRTAGNGCMRKIH